MLLDAGQMEKLLEITAFDNMKKRSAEASSNEEAKKLNDTFFRKGKVGGFAEQFSSPEELEKWNQWVQKKLKEYKIPMQFK